MSAWQYVSSALISILATAVTYVVMHQYVGPGLSQPLVDVPPLIGLLPEQARGLTEPTGLSLIIDGQRESDNDKIAVGSIFEQRPLNGSRLHRGAEVHATLAAPVSKFPVPALSGQQLAAAQKAIVDAGFKAGAVTEVPIPAGSPAVPGTILTSDPPAGTQLRRGETVSLQVAKGSEQVAVPSLRGRSVGSARAALEAVGLVLGDVGKGSDDNAGDGAVLRQNPSAGTQLAKGQKVNIVIND